MISAVVLLSIISLITHPTASRTCIGGGTWVYRQRTGKRPDCPSANIVDDGNDGGYQWGTVADCRSSCESHPTCNVIVRFGSGGVNDDWNHHCYAHSCPDLDNISWLNENRWGVEENIATQWIMTQCITGSPSQSPSALSTTEPSTNPTLSPSANPSAEASNGGPSCTPSRDPTYDPTKLPTSEPIQEGRVEDEMTTTNVPGEYAVGDNGTMDDPLFIVYIIGAVVLAFVLGIILAFICCKKRKKRKIPTKPEMIVPGKSNDDLMEKHDEDTAVYVGGMPKETFGKESDFAEQGIHDAVDDGNEDDMIQNIDNLEVFTGDHGDVIVVNDEFNVATKGNHTASDDSGSFNVRTVNTKTGSSKNDGNVTIATADDIQPHADKMQSLDVDDITIENISNMLYQQ